MANKLLLVDTRLCDFEVITRSLQSDVRFVLMDFQEDSFDTLLTKVAMCNTPSFSNIAIVTHGLQ